MTATIKTMLQFMEDGGRTIRCHTVPTIAPQNVAAHSYGVAWLCYIIMTPNHEPSANLLLHALSHDMAEHVTGDIPAPTKRSLDISDAVQKWEYNAMALAGFELPPLSDLESLVLKLADCLELLMYCVRERGLGNKTQQLSIMYYNAEEYAKDILCSICDNSIPIEYDMRAFDILNIVKNSWREYER